MPVLSNNNYYYWLVLRHLARFVDSGKQQIKHLTTIGQQQFTRRERRFNAARSGFIVYMRLPVNTKATKKTIASAVEWRSVWPGAAYVFFRSRRRHEPNQGRSLGRGNTCGKFFFSYLLLLLFLLFSRYFLASVLLLSTLRERLFTPVIIHIIIPISIFWLLFLRSQLLLLLSLLLSLSLLLLLLPN